MGGHNPCLQRIAKAAHKFHADVEFETQLSGRLQLARDR
jgi:hypothetical protein